MDIRTEEMPTIHVAYLRGVGPYSQTFPRIWPLINAFADRWGLREAGSLFLSIAHNNPRHTAPEAIVGDACVSVPEDFKLGQKGDEGVLLQTIPAGRYLVARYVGPYQGLPEAWGEFCDKILPGQKVRTRSAPPFEIYRTDPKTTAADKNVTELYMAIE